jgi:hypothetical protein
MGSSYIPSRISISGREQVQDKRLSSFIMRFAFQDEDSSRGALGTVEDRVNMVRHLYGPLISLPNNSTPWEDTTEDSSLLQFVLQNQQQLVAQIRNLSRSAKAGNLMDVRKHLKTLLQVKELLADKSSIQMGARDLFAARRRLGPSGLTLLHAPAEPHIDIIFVHGDGGDAFKSWSMEGEESFWPKEWLPKEATLSSARVHTFGYDSGWTADRPRPLYIRDISKMLMAELVTNPKISTAETPIVFVGHSIGGVGKGPLPSCPSIDDTRQRTILT